MNVQMVKKYAFTYTMKYAFNCY